MTKKFMVICFALAVAAMSLPARADLPAYQSAVSLDGAMSLWEFEDASGNDMAPCADSVGLSPGVYRNRTQGTPNDIPPITLKPSDWLIHPGIYFGGQVAEFHGTWGNGYGNFVQIYDSCSSPIPYRLESSPSCSVEFMEKAPTLADETYARFISHAAGQTDNYWVGMTQAGGNPGQPFVGVPKNTWYAWPPMLADNQWHHVVVTYDYNGVDTTTELWIDKVSRGTRKDPGALSITPGKEWTDLLIGAENDPGWVFNGLVGDMDEVAYYGYALSGAQVTAHYDAIFIIPEPATIALLGLGGLALLRKRT